MEDDRSYVEGQQVDNQQDLIVVSIWSLILTYGLITNAVILWIIVRVPSFRTSTSYWLVGHVTICDILMIIISIAHLLPATAFHETFVEVHELRNYVALFLYNIFWYTGILSLAAMAANRFVIIVFPQSYPHLFSNQRTIILIVLLYLCGLAVAMPALFPCCYTVWNHTHYVTYYEAADAYLHYGLLDLSLNAFCLAVMLFCYTCIIFRVRSARRQVLHSSSHSNREIRLFVQFFVLSVVYLATWITWQIAQWSEDTLGVSPPSSKWWYFFCTSLFFINNSTNPTVYMIFNSSMRAQLKSMFFRVLLIGTSSKATTTTSNGMQYLKISNTALRKVESAPNQIDPDNHNLTDNTVDHQLPQKHRSSSLSASPERILVE